MSVEEFFKLKEIDSLSKMRINHLKTINDELNRITLLQKRFKDSELESERLTHEKFAMQDSLAEYEKKLKNAVEQRQRIIDIGGDENKVAQFTLQISKFEDKGFELLEKIDELDTLISEGKTFRTGLAKTIDEITAEITPDVEKSQLEIKNIELRISLLKEDLPENFRTTLEKIVAKNLALGPFTRVEQGSCFICRFKISRIDESEIDMQKGLKTCPQCSRIFLPYGAS